MLESNHFRIEILAKFLSKFSGLIKQIGIIIFIGGSLSFDNYVVATSYTAIILSLISWSEIELIPKLSNKEKENTKKFIFFCSNILVLCCLLSLIVVTVSYSISDSGIALWTVFLSIWSILNVINNLYLILFRINGNMNYVLSYYSKTSLLGMLIYFSLSIINHVVKLSIDYVSILFLSIILPELIFLIKFNLKKNFFRFRYVDFFSFVNQYMLKGSSISVIAILVVVYLIDSSSKYFTTIGSLDDNGASLLFYGSLIPLMFRNVLDVKTLFFAKLNNIVTINEQIKLLKNVFYKMLYIYVPVFLILSLMIFFFGNDLVAKFNFKFNNEQIKTIYIVFYIYSLIVPFYIFWDLVYRFFHLYNHRRIVSSIIVVSLFVSVMLNTILVVKYNLGVVGVSISTLSVFILYSLCSIAYLRFLIKNENINC